MLCQWKTKGCHSHLIEADILLAFTFPPSLDMWNHPWFACQMVSISWAVRCIKTTPWWITVLIVCQSLTLKCQASQRLLLFFCIYLSSLLQWLFIPTASVYFYIARMYLIVITWTLKYVTVCVSLSYVTVRQIPSRVLLLSPSDLSHGVMRSWEWMCLQYSEVVHGIQPSNWTWSA